jgi:hypothetical protein
MHLLLLQVRLRPLFGPLRRNNYRLETLRGEKIMETAIQGSTLQTLRAGLRGTAHAPGEEGYEEACRAWNLAAHQSPALVVVAGGAADVIAAVRFAREGGLGVGVMATAGY